MTPRISLGKCNDINISKIAEMYKAGNVKAGEAVVRDGKEYFVASQCAYTHTTNAMGDISKTYRLKNNGEWHLQNRTVKNERGSYRRGVNSLMGKTSDEVSLGGQSAFQRLEDGTYMQPSEGHYPARIVSSSEIEAAIDYIKGHGAAENYTRLLRDYKN